MQDAWAVDQGTMGDWSDIGYTAPASKNITYGGEDVKTSGQVGWQAGPSNNWTPSSCEGADAWKITVTVGGPTSVTYTPSTSCTALTPNFTSIGASN